MTKWDQWRAFGVHLLTASGALWAFLSIIAAAEGRWVAMFGWLGFALFVDGIDGPIARRISIREVLPNWSGELLDSIIDYVTYVIIPAFALYQAGLMGPRLSFISSALIVFSSAIYYADLRMKTKDNFFRGFPVTWNMLVFTLFALKLHEAVSFLIVLVSVVATFLPIKFLHPVRVVRLRALNLFVFALWSVLAIACLVLEFELPTAMRWGIAASSIYLYCFGGATQLSSWLSRRKAPSAV
ncbi:phosphatidylcholine synthase [Consotaella salsifontis]|uniref:Phosphatidylcholine synthase n=1 Tax=Consotaella salsifontis TaxID=1365950 RepID=A0A1T4SZ34_9HYPH|nr:phosphatidylcholine synthase [Consotaella salsifontis]